MDEVKLYEELIQKIKYAQGFNWNKVWDFDLKKVKQIDYGGILTNFEDLEHLTQKNSILGETGFYSYWKNISDLKEGLEKLPVRSVYLEKGEIKHIQSGNSGSSQANFYFNGNGELSERYQILEGSVHPILESVAKKTKFNAGELFIEVHRDSEFGSNVYFGKDNEFFSGEGRSIDIPLENWQYDSLEESIFKNKQNFSEYFSKFECKIMHKDKSVSFQEGLKFLGKQK